MCWQLRRWKLALCRQSPTLKEIDPELGTLNLSKGGAYPVEYAIRLGAGFGSQISMTLLRWVATKDGVRRSPNALGYAYRIVDEDCWKNWLSRVAGYPTAELEVVHRTLRIRDQGSAARVADVAQKSNEVPRPTPTKPAVPVVDVQQVPPPSPVSRIASASANASARAARRSDICCARRSGKGQGIGAGGREDGLSGGHARP